MAYAVSVKGNTVFAAGRTRTAAGGNAFAVRAYSAKDGSLIWEDHYDREGTGADGANSIAVKGNTVFAAGRTYTAAGSCAFTVRAYSAKDGSLIWEDRYDREGTGWDAAYAVAVKGNTVFAAGLTTTASGGNAFTVRAHSANDGSLIWEDRYDREGTGTDEANSIAVKGNTVFAAGYTSTAAGSPAFGMRAYSAKDGSLIWEDDYDREGTGWDKAAAVAVTGNTVLAAGYTSTAAGGPAFTVRAYSAGP
jgi:TolB-like protein